MVFSNPDFEVVSSALPGSRCSPETVSIATVMKLPCYNAPAQHMVEPRRSLFKIDHNSRFDSRRQPMAAEIPDAEGGTKSDEPRRSRPAGW